MTWIRQNTDGSSESFNFLPAAVGITEGNPVNEVLFPFFEKQEPVFGVVIAVDVAQMDSFIQPGELTGNVTVDLTVDERVTCGAKVHLKLVADAVERTVTLGAGFDAAAAAIVVAADATVFKSFVFDGTTYVPIT